MNSAGRIATALGILAVAAVGTAWFAGLRPADLQYLGKVRNAVEINGVEVPIPLPASSPQRLAPQVSAAGDGSFAFAEGTFAVPVLRDPCLPVEWTLSTAGMPAGAEAIVESAVADIESRTGLDWQYAGLTDAPAAFGRGALEYDGEWGYAPVVIGWADGEVVAELAGATRGRTETVVLAGAFGDEEFLRSATVLLDAGDLPADPASAEFAAALRTLVLHELGHVVGLDHVPSAKELMAPTTTLETWGPGDLAGLARAGAGPCEGAADA